MRSLMILSIFYHSINGIKLTQICQVRYFKREDLLIVIIPLMLSLPLSPKVITLSTIHCSRTQVLQMYISRVILSIKSNIFIDYLSTYALQYLPNLHSTRSGLAIALKNRTIFINISFIYRKHIKKYQYQNNNQFCFYANITSGFRKQYEIFCT
jgi:hypothetical protein